MSNQRAESQYSQLVAARKACRLCDELTNPAEVSRGRLDSCEIGPWTRWQGSLSAKIMVVGQDWGGVKYFRENGGLDRPGNHTNNRLIQLLAELRVRIEDIDAATSNSDVYFTNAVLCLKQGGLQAKVHSSWFQNCSTFLKQQIEIVSPIVVVSLGERALHAVQTACQLRKNPLREAVAEPNGHFLNDRSTLFAVYHPARRVENTVRPHAQQLEDWKRIARCLRRNGV